MLRINEELNNKIKSSNTKYQQIVDKIKEKEENNRELLQSNPNYYLETLKKFNLDPKDCLMVGNDEFEDAWSVNSLGMDCYLVTDRLIPSDKYHHEGPRGTFEDLVKFLADL